MQEKEKQYYPKGVLDKQYHIDRIKKRAHSYRLKRRTSEVLKLIRKYYNLNCDTFIDILDVGTADGLMLSNIKNNLNNCRCYGLEYSMDLIYTNTETKIKLICGDAKILPFKDNSFDILIACAVIEHLSDVTFFMKESYRILKEGGALIITTPVPVWESIFSAIGHIKGDQHQETFNIRKLKELLILYNFKVLENKKFMISPIGFPFENFIENILRTINITFTFGNQIIIGEKNGNK